MTDISGIFSISSSTKHQWIFIMWTFGSCYWKLFSFTIRRNPGAYWYAIYYDSSVDGYNECVEITDKNLIGYVYCDDRVAFVLNSFLERFINDTVDYNIHYVGVESLDEECIECRRYFDYCEHILPALWIDDDFLNNEKLEFDYEKFELIDTGIKYLNPKHFSVKSFVEYCRFSKE